ncbi:MAG: DUF2314 domain-containing protein [Verrucomicrobiota bacterium]
MRLGLNLALALVGCMVFSLAGCSKRDKVISVEDDDAEMNAAIAKARGMLPHFWQVFEKPSPGESDFALKVKITDKNGTEHFWANEIKRQNGKIMGTINNDPNTVKTVKLGSRIEIPEADISDWMYMRGGKMVGNFTLPPLFKHMPAAQVKQLKSIMADP